MTVTELLTRRLYARLVRKHEVQKQLDARLRADTLAMLRGRGGE